MYVPERVLPDGTPTRIEPDVDYTEGQEYEGAVERGHADHPLMQFTGLNDADGKEIYEGDVLEWKVNIYYERDPSVRRGPVGWDGQRTSFYRLDEYTGEPWYFDREDLKGCRVIGNIHENPDLVQ